ncbi:hypothetical protein M3Y99_01768500 [Aphelenchoides fujianensis]|nr:hypothetical protein M3Y99_01768500 [Aphelenchoides fujianensis]
MTFGIWKADKRVLFMLYFSFALGGAMSAVLCTEEVFSRAPIVGRTHVLTKREIANPQLPTFEPLIVGENSTEPPSVVTRPNSAVGIDEVVDTKTKENEERRKQAEAAKQEPPPAKCGANGTNCEPEEK